MQITLNKINKELEIIADKHKQLQGYFFGDYFEALGNDALDYPFVCVTPVSANPVVKQMQITLAIMIVDKYDEGSDRQKAEIWSDANLYFDDLKATFRSLRWTRYMSVDFGALEPLQNHEQDVTCGWIGNVTFNITDYEIFCRVPYDDYDFESDMNISVNCDDATWTLTDEDGNTISSGTIASGGSDTIVAPNADYTLQDEDGTTILTGDIVSGGAENITAPNADYTLQDEDGTTISTGDIVSGGSENITAPNAIYTVEYANGDPIQSGTIPSGGSETIVVPNCPTCDDAIWTLLDSDGNILSSGTIPSGGSATITAPDSNYTLTDEDGTIILTGDIVSGGIENITAPNADYTLQDEDGSTILTGDIVSGGSENITAPNADYTVEYVNGMLIQSGDIVSGGNETIQVPNCADADVTVNTVSYGSAPSGGNLNVEVVDQDGNDVGSLNGSGQWEVTTGGSCLNTSNPIKTGVTTSATTGDDGDTQRGRLTDWYTIEAGQDNNNFPHNFRFIGINGGYQDPTTGNYFDVNGVASTRGAEFPSDLIIDRSTYDQTTGNYLMYAHVNVARVWLTQVSTINSLSLSGFSGFKMINANELMLLCNYEDTGTKDLLDYNPFNINFGGSANNSIWTGSFVGSGSASALAFSNNLICNTGSSFIGIANTYKSIAVRITNISEL